MILARDHISGSKSRGIGGYIDHVIFRDKDANTAWTAASDGTLEERRYYCQNQGKRIIHERFLNGCASDRCLVFAAECRGTSSGGQR